MFQTWSRWIILQIKEHGLTFMSWDWRFLKKKLILWQKISDRFQSSILNTWKWHHSKNYWYSRKKSSFLSDRSRDYTRSGKKNWDMGHSELTTTDRIWYQFVSTWWRKYAFIDKKLLTTRRPLLIWCDWIVELNDDRSSVLKEFLNEKSGDDTIQIWFRPKRTITKYIKSRRSLVDDLLDQEVRCPHRAYLVITFYSDVIFSNHFTVNVFFQYPDSVMMCAFVRRNGQRRARVFSRTFLLRERSLIEIVILISWNSGRLLRVFISWSVFASTEKSIWCSCHT